MHDFLKTANGEREVDLHPSMAAMLREYISRPVGSTHFLDGRWKPKPGSSLRQKSAQLDRMERNANPRPF
ncbi:MAG: hypothetical protein DMG41_28170 [Acidobacteria bacterium]|nr:MAG: hypothetical protein AUH13_30885 [Acidobacteria bacterium 13_2_20CM_58_27]PYT67013.1 MAG: hypothetical protein DMG42_27910 [Acidobacteriota bacterium]PYT84237.1 MAG: hypothetical protein DMG41_28170 [Acidobacteriota bacterium]